MNDLLVSHAFIKTRLNLVESVLDYNPYFDDNDVFNIKKGSMRSPKHISWQNQLRRVISRKCKCYLQV